MDEKRETRRRLCTCACDGFAALPPELRPRPRKKGNLRQVTCPCCGLLYWTNRPTDLCIECEQKQGTITAAATIGNNN